MNLRKILRQEKPLIISIIFTLLFIALVMPYVWKSPYIEHVSFAVLDEDNSALSRKITELVKTNNYVDVNYYPSSEDDLEKAIKKGKVYGGLIIPKDFSKDVALKKTPDCLVVVDGSNVMVGGNALNGCATVLSTLSAGTELKILEGSGMNPTSAQTSLGSFTAVDRAVYEPTGGYTPRMMYALMIMLVQQIMLINFVMPLFTERKKYFVRGSKKENIENIKDILVRIAVVFVSCIVISFGALLIVGKMRGLPLRGNIFVYIVLMILFMLDCLGISIAISAFAKSGTIIRWIYYMLSTTITFFSGAAYPFYMMPDWLSKMSHIIIPMANLSMAFKALNLKGVGFSILMPDIMNGIKYMVFWLPVGIVLYVLSIFIEKKKVNNKLGNTENLVTE